MTRDHMMGFKQPNDETHGEGRCGRFPLGSPVSETEEERKLWVAFKEDKALRLAMLAFENGDHQPDGTVLPARQATAVVKSFVPRLNIGDLVVFWADARVSQEFFQTAGGCAVWPCA